MTSRERVLAALNHQEPDRVPIDFSGHRSSGIAAMAYARLRDHLGLPKKPIRVYDPVQQLAIVDEDVLERFQRGHDRAGPRLRARRQVLGRLDAARRHALPDARLGAAGARQRRVGACARRSAAASSPACPRASGTSSRPTGRSSNRTTWTSIEAAIRREHVDGHCVAARARWSPGPDGAAGAPAKARAGCAQQTDRAIIGLFGGNLLEIRPVPLPQRQLPHAAGRRAASAPTASSTGWWRCTCATSSGSSARSGRHIDIILFGDDLGMQTGPQISPAMYREFFKPRARAHVAAGQGARADVKVMLHCCGGVRELLPDLIDAGLDAINPVQITCRGMDAAGLKRDFGDRLTFWGGGCDTRDILPQGHARRRSASTSASRWRSGGPAAASSSSRSTTSWPTCRPRTSSPMYEASVIGS